LRKLGIKMDSQPSSNDNFRSSRKMFIKKNQEAVKRRRQFLASENENTGQSGSTKLSIKKKLKEDIPSEKISELSESETGSINSEKIQSQEKQPRKLEAPSFVRSSQEGAKLATVRREILSKVRSSVGGKTSRRIDDRDLSSAISPFCSPGWISAGKSKCFSLSGKVVASSWSDARSRCTRLKQGAELASVEDQYQLNVVLGSPDLVTPCFIGASDAGSEGRWKWVDGSLWTWGKEETQGNKKHNCLEMRVITNKQGINLTAWSGVECDKVLPRSFICSYKRGKPFEDSVLFTIETPFSERDSKGLITKKFETDLSNNTNSLQEVDDTRQSSI